MRSSPHISCIIPFWNEGPNLIEVVSEISKTRYIDEIICVDDASTDSNHLKLKQFYPLVKLVRLRKNLGKTGAVREGMKIADGEYILLLDADLRNLDHREIDSAVSIVMINNNIDMLILRRINALFYIKFYRADVLFTGERILKKKDLNAILEGPVERWQLESAINTWMYKNNKKVYWVPHSGINKQKFMKWGIFDGLKLDFRTFTDMISATGFNNFIRQILFFARNELKHDGKDSTRHEMEPAEMNEEVKVE
jgi:glycosyltransferase involved in cell wall biosynthesis